MPKFFVTNQDVQNQKITITGEDVNHIKNVLRKKLDDEINICNRDTEKDFLCKITKIEKETIIANIVEEIESNAEAQVEVTIFQGLPKADKMEFIIQKAVELGVFAVTPIEMKRCVVQLKDKDKQKKQDRWQKIAEVAAKQSGRNRIPKINDIISIKNVCNLCSKYDIVLVAYENEKQNKLRYELEKIKAKETENLRIAIVIGPEGGIDSSEIEQLKENGAKVITLGNRILRTETVALHILSIIMYELEG